MSILFDFAYWMFVGSTAFLAVSLLVFFANKIYRRIKAKKILKEKENKKKCSKL